MQTGNNKNYSGIEELINTEVMKKYNHFIVASAIKNAHSTSQVIDFGAGIGTAFALQAAGSDMCCGFQ